MSMARCDTCDRIIDTDEDPDCFWYDFSELEPWDGIMCDSCRDRQPEKERYCLRCDGTGIGQFGDPDTSKCSYCGGSGLLKHDPSPDDRNDGLEP